ncbi:transposase [Streptomyces flaveolus]|uniref:transposase n=1 Tax=Streptomyces flaveolus TaxID=67297 RepID=UPI003329D9EE
MHTGIQWEYLPQELGFGSGMTCWRRLAAWNEAGVWDQLHQLLLNELRSKNQLDWERAVIDSSHVRAARRGPKAGRVRSTEHGRAANTTSSSTDRASRSRCRCRRKPRATSPNSSRCSTRFPPSRARATDPADAPTHCLADRGYDHDKYRRLLWQRGIRPVIAKRGEPHGTGLDIFRYVVERTIAWLHGFRRLRIRWTDATTSTKRSSASPSA